MLTLLIAKFVTFTWNSRCHQMWSCRTFVNISNVDHVVELYYQVQWPY